MARGALLGAAGPWLAAWLALSGIGCGAPTAPPSALNERSRRSVLAPTRFGWLSSQQASRTLPSAIPLGGRASGRSLLYFEFAALAEPGPPLRAELVLSVSGASGDAVDIELSRADRARELTAWSDQPRALFPRVAARLVAQAESWRLDVTEIVRTQGKPGQPLCLLLRAEPAAGAPVLVETGVAGGSAPRLEAYWE